MKLYIGAIAAEPCDSAEGQPGYKVEYPDGHISWSPKETFETAYREVTLSERDLVDETTGD